MDALGKAFVGFLAFMALFGGVIIYVGYKQDVRKTEACEAAGGIKFKSQGGKSICIRKDAVIAKDED